MFSKEQVKFIKTNYQRLPLKQLVLLFNNEFESTFTTNQIRSYCKNHNIKSGRTGQFVKGHKSWNSDSKGLTGRNKTSFKPGNRPANWRPVGAERICSKDGFILVKVEIADPYTKSKTRYMHKHVYIYEQAYGKVPRGYVIKFKDGNKLNCNLDNLICLRRSELLYLNRHNFIDVPDEAKESFITLSKLACKLNEVKNADNKKRMD